MNSEISPIYRPVTKKTPNSVVEVGPGYGGIFINFFPDYLKQDKRIKRIAIYPKDNLTTADDFLNSKVKIVHHNIYLGPSKRIKTGSAAALLMQNVVNDSTSFLQKNFSKMEEFCSHVLCKGGSLVLVDVIQRNQSLYAEIKEAMLAKGKFRLFFSTVKDSQKPEFCLFDYLAKNIDSAQCLDDVLGSGLINFTRTARRDEAMVYIYRKM